MEEESSKILNLPNEIIQKILKKLPHKDLKNALQVCTKMKAIGENPTLWTKFHLHIGSFSFSDLDCLDCIFKLERFQNLRYLTVLGHHLDNYQIQNIFENIRY